ncbi:MAG TPA: type VI secretion system tube protein TssD [Flavipsychrobacter sp.]|nr:type VI secretion system tube protein TssD [Flavipsychrobacter sp.]
MALNSYLVVVGEKQGTIKGGVIQKGREGWIEINAYHHEVVSPRDASSGLATGRRQHKPFVFTMDIDVSVIAFYNAFINGEKLKTVEVKCFSPQRTGASGGGVETLHFTILLTNAAIVSMENEMLNNNDPALVNFEKRITIALVYESIQWTWVQGNKSAQDSFNP